MSEYDCYKCHTHHTTVSKKCGEWCIKYRKEKAALTAAEAARVKAEQERDELKAQRENMGECVKHKPHRGVAFQCPRCAEEIYRLRAELAEAKKSLPSEAFMAAQRKTMDDMMAEHQKLYQATQSMSCTIDDLTKALASTRAHHQYDVARKDAALKDNCSDCCGGEVPEGYSSNCQGCPVGPALTPSTPAEAEAWKKEQEKP